MRLNRFPAISAIAAVVVLCVGLAAHGAVIYSDDFDGPSASDLHGTAPDTRPGFETWTANSLWKADGSKSANGYANAWLPFTPAPGHIYTLSLDVNPDISGSNDWFSIGFSNGNTTSNWHTNADEISAWMLNRENDASNSVIQTFLGPDTGSAASHDLNPDVVGPVEVQVVLNTQAPAWTAEWFADGQSLRGPEAFGTNPVITHVGFGAWNTATGTVDNFSLADETTGDGVGGEVVPYTADANTLHLWHLDEADPGPALPASGVTGSFNLTPVNGATLGASSFAGFGSAGGTSGGSDDALQGSSVDISTMTGADGAFTVEAIINVSTIGGKQGIIMMDAAGGVSGRPFQFAIQDGNLQFIDIANGVQFLETAIPNFGDHAFVANEWFHVAATYDGNENTEGNFKLYWTALDSSAEEANLIFAGNLLNDLAGGSAVFGVGNEFRSTPGENLEGLIDEVRISDIARGANDFLFAPAAAIPEPSTFVLAALGLLGLALCARRRRRLP